VLHQIWSGTPAKAIFLAQSSGLRISYPPGFVAGVPPDLPPREPLRGSKEHVEELLEASETAAELVDALQR